MTRIEITTGSRLHFGLICSSPSAAWRFGGIGVMLREPGWQLRVDMASSNDDVISASPAVEMRIQEFLRRIRTTLHVAALRIDVSGRFPFHTGLGGGTQLGLALAAAIELMHFRRLSDDPFQLARLLDRAERSAVGTVGFAKGGFLIDHGEPVAGDQTAAAEEPTPASLIRLVDRIPFPEDWRFVLARPANSQGLSGTQEQSFFSRCVNMPDDLVANLEQQILARIAPAIIGRQFDLFALSLEQYGQTVGRFYATEQGGVFSHPAMTQLAAQLRSEGISGMAQSSWGPLIGIPAESLEMANAIMRLIPDSIQGSPLTLHVSEPLNTGATIRSTVDDSVASRRL